ncbi:MAG: acyltransferase [Candidatus Omnitrophica bacterium]|nr:acyltransferase [Candidatus Omnitrophota bacterium]
MITRFCKGDYLKSQTIRFGAIDGLRGYLALGVFIHHFMITYYWKTQGAWGRPLENYFKNIGRDGVSIFFMITGFLFVTKLLKDRAEVDWIKIYQSRVFRVYPLYLCALFIISIIVFSASSFQLNVPGLVLIKQYIRWFAYFGEQLNDFANTKLIIAGVDWTLKYEWLFYFSLPIINLTILRGRWTVAILSLLIIGLFIHPVTYFEFNSEYFILFLIGGYAAWFRLKKADWWEFFNSNIFSGVVLLALVLLMSLTHTSRSFHTFLLSIFFVPIALGNTMFGLFHKKASIFLGEISFSIYLLHGLVLYVIFSILFPQFISEATYSNYITLMPFLAVIVVLISWGTYSFIERPCMEFGKNSRIKRRELRTDQITDMDRSDSKA